MIQETDFRIGDYVLYNGHYRKIVSINLGTDVNAEPIPLSEELLLKCGFEKDFNFSFSKGSIRFELDISDKWCFFWNINSDESIFICEVKYLHTIQNITYDLTNEELQINL